MILFGGPRANCGGAHEPELEIVEGEAEREHNERSGGGMTDRRRHNPRAREPTVLELAHLSDNISRGNERESASLVKSRIYMWEPTVAGKGPHI